MRYAGCGARARRGVSLLEVLISIFVLSIGLLGVAAVIPVAGHQLLQASKADVGSACGQAALGDIKVRGALNPGQWQGFDGTNWSTIGTTKPPPSTNPPYFDARRGYEFGESYALDPLYVAETTKVSGANSTHFADFPYNPSNPGTRVVPGLNGRWTRLQRVTWSRVGLSPLLAQSVFKWHDDLLFTVPVDQDERPRQMLELLQSPTSGVQRRPFPALPHEPPVMDTFRADFQGNYSWLVTVTPLPEHIDFIEDPSGTGVYLPYSFPENSPVYTVSVAVFYKRDMSAPNHYASGQLMAGETPGERQVRLEFQSSGTALGGGDVVLYVLPGDGGRPEYLAVKENEWLLVSGGYRRTCYYYDDIHYDPPQSRPAAISVGVHKWYRIVATGEIVVEDQNGNGTLDPGEDSNSNGVLDPPYREVTLAGPDWNVANWGIDINGDGNSNEALAGLFKGVVGVFSTDMKLY